MGILGGLGKGMSRAASRTASKVGKDPARRADARSRLNRMNRKRVGREFLKGMLDSQGLNTEGIARNQKSKTGGLLRAMGYNPAQDGFDFTAPSLSSPERVSAPTNPTISSLDDQLKKIAKTAAELGVISKKQQEQLLKEATATEAASREQQLEQPHATPLGAENVGDSIGPADSAIEKLIGAIAGLQAEIDDKVREAQQGSMGNTFLEGMLDSLGLGGVKSARAAKRATPQLKKGFREVKGGGYQNVKTGKFASADDALKNFKTVDPKFLNKAAKGRQATAVLGKSSGKVAGALGGAIAKSKAGVGAATKIGKEAIAKIARPLVSKSLVKTGLKSIPIAGAVAGGLFAIGRLLKGDVVGAGLEAASGLGGPLTAIPALVLSLARDVYMGAFGVAPETDPQVGPRMAMVKGTVEELAQEALGKKVTKAGGSTAAPASQTKPPAIPQAPSSKPSAPPVATPAAAPPPPTSAPPAASKPAASAGSGASSGAPSSSGAGSASTTPAGGTAQQVSEQKSSKKLEGEEAAAPPASGSAPEVKSMSGEKILQASTEQPPTAAGMGMTGSSPPSPATLPTTKGRAKGMGDVPEPTYLNLGSIAKQLYFGSVAGVMAA